jgi:hypothetical protein
VLSGCRTGIARPVAQPRQQLLVGATAGDLVLGQLEFPLPPPLFGVLTVSRGADVVVAKLRERDALDGKSVLICDSERLAHRAR